jgi:hypothetical protein
MSRDWMLETLVGLGLKEIEAEVYVFLATNGPQEAKGIGTAKAIGVNKSENAKIAKTIRTFFFMLFHLHYNMISTFDSKIHKI